MGTIPTTDDLKCYNCGQARFLQVIRKRYHPSQGISDALDGLRCADCNADLDLNQMVDMHKMNLEKAELKARQEELEEQYRTAGQKIPGHKVDVKDAKVAR